MSLRLNNNSRLGYRDMNRNTITHALAYACHWIKSGNRRNVDLVSGKLYDQYRDAMQGAPKWN